MVILVFGICPAARSAVFESIPSRASDTALAGARTAAVQNASGLFDNPACLARIAGRRMCFFHTRLFGMSELPFTAIGGITPVSMDRTLAWSFQFLDARMSGSMRWIESSWNISLAWRGNEQWRLGVRMGSGGISVPSEDVSAESMHLDAGAVRVMASQDISRLVAIALYARQLVSALTWSGRGVESMPPQWHLGLWTGWIDGSGLSADLAKRDDGWRLAVGCEYDPPVEPGEQTEMYHSGKLPMRLGIAFDRGVELSAGFGVSLARWMLDVSWQYRPAGAGASFGISGEVDLENLS